MYSVGSRHREPLAALQPKETVGRSVFRAMHGGHFRDYNVYPNVHGVVECALAVDVTYRIVGLNREGHIDIILCLD